MYKSVLYKDNRWSSPMALGFFFQMLLILDWILFSFTIICLSHVSEPLDSQPLNVHPDPLH